VTNYHGLLACRILLGVFEASVPPCLMLITGETRWSSHWYGCVIQIFVTGIWYTKPEGVRRFTFWYCGTGLGQIMGGLISWVTQTILVLMVVSST